ncbi:AAA family ATPase [Pseudomonas caspiana]|nr:AAA family ATPase [Pseudomonas caspiana]TPG86000.1 AAA family ATPase [Pseudomonas caspiana]
MRAEVMQHFGLTVPFKQSGYYETEHHKDLIKDVRGAVLEGRLVAICGVIGSGKTVLLRRLTKMLQDDKKVIVSKSVAVDKHNIKLATLIEALYYDLSSEKQVQIPKKIERRDRQLQEIILKGKKPIVMFVDEAHDLNGHTLTGLKRLMELAEDVDGLLSIVLAGHPKLRNDLRKDNMEEIGARTDVFSLDGITGAQREYIDWLLRTCSGNEGACETILTDDAIDLLASKLRTPLQVQLHLALALEAGYQTGERPVSVAVIESVLSRHIDDLEPTLTRNGYRMKDLVDQFNAKAHEFKSLFNNTLDPERASELRDKMLAAGIPL